MLLSISYFHEIQMWFFFVAKMSEALSVTSDERDSTKGRDNIFFYCNRFADYSLTDYKLKICWKKKGMVNVLKISI